MIADLDETIRKTLQAELPIKNGEVEVAFDQPKREWSARLSRPAVNFFLYDVRENPVLRQHQWEQAVNGGLADDRFHLKRSPFRVDCHYMLTVWASDPQDEHRLLSRCLLALFRLPVLPEKYLVGGLKNQPFEIPTHLASHDKFPNPAEVWSALDNEMRPSISYIITLALDPWTEVSGPLVRTLTLRSGQSLAPTPSMRLAENTLSELVDLGGVVRSRENGSKPLPGTTVAIKDTGFLTTTDQNGRYTLGSLPPGSYTLVAWPPQGKPTEKQISLPGKTGAYDFEL